MLSGSRHSGESRNPVGRASARPGGSGSVASFSARGWIPAFAGMTLVAMPRASASPLPLWERAFAADLADEALASRMAGRVRGEFLFRRGFAAYPSPRAKRRACSPARGERGACGAAQLLHIAPSWERYEKDAPPLGSPRARLAPILAPFSSFRRKPESSRACVGAPRRLRQRSLIFSAHPRGAGYRLSPV
jgi:hypothetical protein